MPPITWGNWGSDTSSSNNIEIQGDTFTLASTIPDSVVARFKFEQSLQDSENGYDSTHSTGSPSYSTDSQEGSYSLNKSGSNYVTIPYDVNESAFSWIGWVNFASDGEWIDNRDGSFNGAGRITLNNGVLNAKSDNWSIDLTTSLSQGTWTHIVYQYENGTAELYKDGSLVDSGSPSDPANGRPDVYIGRAGGGIGGGAAVKADDVMMANSRLSSSQVSDIYQGY